MFNKEATRNNIRLYYPYSAFKSFTLVYLPVRILFYASIGISVPNIFILEMISSLVTFLTDIPLGVFSDKIGHKTSVLLGNICSVICFLIIVNSTSFLAQAIAMIFLGLGDTFNSGAETSLIYDSFELCGITDKYIKISGKINLFSGIVPIFFLGGLLGEYGVKIPFYLTIFSYGALILISCLFHNTNTHHEKKHKFIDENYWEYFKISCNGIFQNKYLFHLTLLYCLLDAIRMPIFLLVQTLMKDYGFSSWTFGALQNGWSYVALIAVYLIHFVEKKMGTIYLVFVSLFIITISSICIGFLNSPFSILLIIPIASGIRIGLLMLSKNLNEGFAAEVRSTTWSILSTCQGLIFILLNIITSRLLHKYSQQTIILAIGFVFGIAFLIIAFQLKRTHKQIV